MGVGGWSILVAALWGCRPEDPARPADTGTPQAPRLLEVVEGPSFGVPDDAVAYLVGEVRLTTSVPATATLRIDGPCGRDEIRFGEATEHVLTVAGLHQDAEHQLSVLLEGSGERLEVEVGPVVTEAVPDLPPVTVHAFDPEGREPGLLVFTPYHDEDKGWVLAVDEALHLVYALPQKVEDLTLEPGGTWVANFEERVVRWDLLGREVMSWNDGTHRVHHEAFALPDGGVLTFSGEEAVEPDYPDDASLQTTSEHTLLTQQVLRFDAAGEVVERHRLAELLDTTHVGYLSLKDADPKDWAHANSVVPWDDDSYLVSVRHLDVILCLERDGTLRWMMGDPAGWESPWAELFLEPVDPTFRWFRHTHALEVHEDGLVALFDNGNFGGSPYNPPDHIGGNTSRGLALRIDEADGTFEEVWSLPHQGLFSPGQGDADVLPETGNVLLVFAMLGLITPTSRIVELNPERPDEPVLDVTIGGDVKRYVYRAEVVPSLFPLPTD